MQTARIVAIVILLIAAIMLITSQRGGWAYLSPHTLEYRVQSERTLFASSVPICRSRFRQVENPLVNMLIAEGFVAPEEPETNRWEIIFHWNNAWRDGYGPLYDVFLRHDREIMQWTHENPECAKIYWSEGFRLLRSENKIDNISGREILVRCWRIKDSKTLQDEIDRIKDEVAETMAM